MPTLILMRHAKSDWSFAEPDHERPLNARGIANARAMGDWLRAQGLAPDMAQVSTARRTRETFGLLGLDTAAQFLPTLYHAEPEIMLDCLREADGETVLMVGHNPGITEFAHMLLAEPPAHERWDALPTCATLVAAFDTPWNETTPGTGRALHFVVPKEL
ncbi:SixA phosphatase family protein [Thetidibacter halocola]|uniref:Histidine phosphatase family protein n=1 Tax=Thetidibacter halocola TaxID=2827239 RepID=A0A8J8BAV9_9RHOB|nr:histidine phosphatase family protein [Thetidibacter halocola]MBS0125628.1 histidine phosphatase family protein [Thetidibacter halocola]